MADQRPIRIVSSANEAYAIGLAAVIASTLSTAASPSRVEFLVLDCGLTSATRRKLSDLVGSRGGAIRFIAVDLAALGDVDAGGHGGRAAYARVLSPALLDEHGPLIYLDADVIVRRDLAPLLDHVLDDEDTWAWAAPDVGVSFVSSPTAVFDWKERGMDAWARYFNSGVLVLDLDIWRRAGVMPQTLHYLQANAGRVSWWDQGGLNAVLYGRWRALDLRWNQTHAVLRPLGVWLDAGFDRDTYESVAADPFIVHFSGSVKPWHYGCADPRAPEFFRALAGTPWEGVTPRTPYRQTWPWRALRKVHRVSRRLSSNLVRRAARTLSPRHRRAVRADEDARRGFDSLMQTLAADVRVRSGPFAGMRYVAGPSWGHLGPLLIGSYESELHEVIEEFIARGCTTVVDVGCAEGYYLIGLARRLPGATLHGFDIDPTALALCRQMASLNGVEDRVHLHGACTPDALDKLIDDATLLVIDCEGYELDLLDPRLAPRLAVTDMIVELHDFIDPSISSRLAARFRHTHDTVVLDVEPRVPGRYRELEGWPDPVQRMLLDECRPVDPYPMQWAVFRSKARRRSVPPTAGSSGASGG